MNVAAPGNLLALLPTSDINASSVASYDPHPQQLVDNLVNTVTTEDGLIFADSDTDQRVAVTGFDSSIGLLRLFLDPTDLGRFPSSVAVYYSTVSTTSIDSTAPFYSGAEGDTLLSMLSLSPGLLTLVPGAHAGYLNIPVDAPSGTQTLLLDFGSANGEGDRISELQAFAVPEPNPLTFIAIAMAAFLVLRRPRSNRRMADMASVWRSVP